MPKDLTIKRALVLGSGAIRIGQAGEYPVVFTVSDTELFDSETVIITVTSYLLEPPVLINPPNGSVGVSLNPDFSWEESLGADYYHLQVGTEGFSSLLIDEDGLTDTSYTPAQPLDYAGRAAQRNIS